MDDNAYKCLKLMREVNPKAKMIYIGEWSGGCTADDNFFEILKLIKNDTKFYEAVKNYLTWYCLHDRPYLIK